MSLNNDKENEIQVESEFDNLNISDNDSNSVIINHENCYEKYGKPWCKECVPRIIIEGWTSGHNDIDNFIKDTIYYAEKYNEYHNGRYCDVPLFLEWVPFDKFTDIKQIGEGGFAKVYSTTWIDGKAKYTKQDDAEPMTVALKRLNGSQNISTEYLNEIKIHWDLYKSILKNSVSRSGYTLKIYGITKDPETNEFMMIMQFADKGNLRYILSNFGLSSRPSNESKSDDKVYGVLPYIAPEVLNGEKYTLSSDIYSFGIIMTELSSGKPPFYKRKHDSSLALEICNGLRPEFEKGTSEIYKKLAYRCMYANPDQRPTANELNDILSFWYQSICDCNEEKFGYKGKEIKAMFKEADKEIPNILASYKTDPDAIYTSRAFTFSNLSKPINSSIINSYLNDNKDSQDSQLVNLNVPSSLQLNDNADDN